MEAVRREGSLEATVAASRNRNLAVAMLFSVLILAAGFMLLRATRSSRRLAEEQMRFVANVTHELRTPLTVIRGAAHNLKRGIVKDQTGVPVSLAAKEAKLLRLLFSSKGNVVSRDEILGQLWAEQPFITPRTVDVHIAWLRQKLEDQPDSPKHILTVRGEGYRFVP